jgi:hypothetical protein
MTETQQGAYIRACNRPHCSRVDLGSRRAVEHLSIADCRGECRRENKDLYPLDIRLLFATEGNGWDTSLSSGAYVQLACRIARLAAAAAADLYINQTTLAPWALRPRCDLDSCRGQPTRTLQRHRQHVRCKMRLEPLAIDLHT